MQEKYQYAIAGTENMRTRKDNEVGRAAAASKPSPLHCVEPRRELNRAKAACAVGCSQLTAGSSCLCVCVCVCACVVAVQIKTTKEFAIQRFSKDLLSVADVVELALKHPPSQMEESHEVKQLFLGLEGIQKNLLKVFESHGITVHNPVGEEFDPNTVGSALPARHHGRDHDVRSPTADLLAHLPVLR